MENQDVHDPNSYFNYLKEQEKELNVVSPTFCLAKWLQSTILLYNGECHCCHHPPRHKIKPSDIKDNPKGIHNTSHIMQCRQDLLDGKQTPECDYCWKIENLDKGYLSDRIYKSTFSWSLPYLQDIVDSGTGPDTDPTYMEVAFESTCNFKCLYCSPESSTKWEQEIIKHGPIKQKRFNLHDLNWLEEVGKLPIPADQPNPYIDAFWKWWPTLYPKLHTFRITGGEPLLSKHTWKILEYIKKHDHPNPNLILAINTNCNAPGSMVDKMIDYINDISHKIKHFDVYTSIESVGPQAEYARYGLNYEEFRKNCYKILDSTLKKTRLHMMTTISLLAAPTFIDFLKLITEMRTAYPTAKHEFRVRTHLTFIRWPQTLQLTLLNDEDKKRYGDEWLEYVEANKLTNEKDPKEIFYLEEVDQIKRLVDYMRSKKESRWLYEDMRSYIKQCDQRRGLNFVDTFPELSYLMDTNYYG